jgi:hypothetical protein
MCLFNNKTIKKYEVSERKHNAYIIRKEKQDMKELKSILKTFVVKRTKKEKIILDAAVYQENTIELSYETEENFNEDIKECCVCYDTENIAE